MQFLIDKEINLEKDDLLNTKGYVDTLVKVIQNAPLDTGFTIGLFGEWGSGKSSIVKTVSERLDDNNKSAVKFIIYDAWKYSNDSFRRMFLMKMADELKLEKSNRFDAFYRNKSSDLTVDSRVNEKMMALTLAIFGIGAFLVYWAKNLGGDIQITLAIVISALGVLVNIASKSFTDFKVTVAEPMIFAPEQFEECFSEIIQAAMKPESFLKRQRRWIKGKGPRKYEKIVIVVDNIDRCDSKTSFELITNIKNFLGKREKILFLIPVDDGALKKHISQGKKEEEKDAEEFLRKFFNVTIRMKAFKVFDLYDLTNEINRRNGLGFDPNTIDIIAKEYATNPRRIIQFFNDLIAEMSIFTDKYGIEFSKKHESLICKALILKEEWPKYYEWLSRNPQYLNNPDEDSKKISIKEDGLDLFLSLTNSINQLTDNSDIETIFSSHDRSLNVPGTVGVAIATKDFPVLEKLIEEKVISSEKVLDRVIELISVSLQRRTYQISTNSLMEIVGFIHEKYGTNDSFNRKLSDTIRWKANLFIPYLNEFKLFCKYAKDIENRYPYLLREIYAYLKKEFNSNNESDPKWGQFVKFFTAVFEQAATYEIEELKNVFNENFERLKIPIAQFNFEPKSLRAIIDPVRMQVMVEKIQNFNLEDIYLKEAIYISEKIQLTEPEIMSILVKFRNLVIVNRVASETLVEAGNYIISILDGQSPVKPHQALAPILQELYSKMIRMRMSNGVTRNYFIKSDATSHQKTSLRILMNFYKMANEDIDVQDSIRMILEVNQELHSPFLLLCEQFKVEYNFSLVKFRTIIMESIALTSESISIKKYLLEEKVHDEWIVKEDEVRIFVKHIVVECLENHDIKLELLNEILKGQRARAALVDIGLELNQVLLSRMPKKHLVVIFDYLIRGDNLFNYQDRIELLKLMMKKGDHQHVSRVIDLLIAKLQFGNKTEDVLNILEQAREISAKDIKRLVSEFDKIMENNTKEEAHRIILNKTKGSDKFPPGLNIIRAIYASGENGVEENVTRKLRSLIVDNKIVTHVGNDLVENSVDPHPGVVKTLSIIYSLNGKKEEMSIKEHNELKLPDT